METEMQQTFIGSFPYSVHTLWAILAEDDWLGASETHDGLCLH